MFILQWDIIIVGGVCCINAMLRWSDSRLFHHQIILLWHKVCACLHHCFFFFKSPLLLRKFKVLLTPQGLGLCIGLRVVQWGLRGLCPCILHKEWTYFLRGGGSWRDTVWEGPSEWQFHIQRVEWAYLCSSFIFFSHLFCKYSIVLLIKPVWRGIYHHRGVWTHKSRVNCKWPFVIHIKVFIGFGVGTKSPIQSG